MAELKPCPFCGGKATIIRISAVYSKDTFFATCTDCGVEMPRVAINREQAAEAWNRRAGSVVSAHWEYAGESDGKKIYRCTNCQMLLSGTGNFCKECGAKMDEEVE